MPTQKYYISGQARDVLVQACREFSKVLEDQLEDFPYRVRLFQTLEGAICVEVIASDEEGVLYILPFIYGNISTVPKYTDICKTYISNEKNDIFFGIKKGNDSKFRVAGVKRRLTNIVVAVKNILATAEKFKQPISYLYFDVGSVRYKEVYSVVDPSDESCVRVFLSAYSENDKDQYGITDLRNVVGSDFVDF